MEENEIKISDLLEHTNPNDNDFLHIIDVKNGIDKKITLYNLLKNIPAKKITDAEVRIWNLIAGVYLLPEGCKIYYKGATDNTYKLTNSKALLIVTECFTDFKTFYMLSAATTTNQDIYYGYSNVSNGSFDGFDFSDVITSNATTEKDGYMSSEDKTKLDGIENNANNYVHPTGAGYKHIPTGGSSGQILKWSSNGTASWEDDNNIKNFELLQKQDDMVIEAGTTISNGYSITLPTTYTVGRNNLELYWNGQRLIPKTSSNTDGHYQESGTTGNSSSTITMYRSDSDGDYTLTEDVHLHVVVKGKNIS